MDSQITFSMCVLIVNSLSNFKNSLQSESRERKSFYESKNAFTANAERKKSKKGKHVSLLFNSSNNLMENHQYAQNYKVMIDLFKSRYFENEEERNKIRKFKVLLF